ncbi:MAG: FAD-binding oxidoreductase [Kiloniellales bacterium]
MTRSYDAIVVGGGMVGSAIAFGLQRLGLSTVMLDEGDVAFRAARGNFGLVWVQSKGIDFPPYARWTWESAEAWAELHAEIQELTGVDTAYSRPGGIEVCLDEAEFSETESSLNRLQSHQPEFTFQMLDRKTLAEELPGLGDQVVGGSYSPADGHANPLYLLRGLQAGFRAKGGRIEVGARVTAIHRQGRDFSVMAEKGAFKGRRLVLAAGLGTNELASMVGFHVPVHPLRGQLLVTERVQPFLHLPMSLLRQTNEGSVLLGDSHEDVGFDEGTTTGIMNRIANRATRVFPFLKRARVVRAWGSLRIMTPDGYPIYEQPSEIPGLFAAACHSGVTLAAVHVYRLAKSIRDGALPEMLHPMGAKKFSHAAD